MAKQVFFSFHYQRDHARAAQVRNIGAIEGNTPAADNDWETITRGGDEAIKRWISKQLDGRSCTVVLVGTHTANRRWIDHEIIESWNRRMGVVGIRVHGLKNLEGLISTPGANPFDSVTFKDGRSLSSVVRCYDPAGADSKARYAWISNYLANAIDEAISIRQRAK